MATKRITPSFRSSPSRNPRWMTVIKSCSTVHLTVSSSIVIFGIGVSPIYQGFVGIISALEGYHGVQNYNTTRVQYFLIGLIVNIAIAGATGVLAITNSANSFLNPVDVCEQSNKGTAKRSSNGTTAFFINIDNSCEASYQLFGVVEVAFCLLSVCMFVIVSLSYRTMKRDCTQLKLVKETEYERFLFS